MRVACVGASAAGLGTALELLKLDRSIDVTLFDKKGYVGASTVCGGAISSAMLKELKMKLPKRVIASKINSVRVYAPNGSYWGLESESEVYGYVLWRDMFERVLAEQVLGLGGKIRMNHKIDDLTELAGYDYIVSARGLTELPKLEDVHIGVQTIAHVKNHPKNRMDIYFGNEIAPKGYGWVFPLGFKKARVGLGIPLAVKANPKKLLDSFIEKVEAEPISKVKGKLITTAKPPRKLTDGNLVLVGDAAHLCDPLTGGGVVQAILSGKYAAKAISEGKLEKYDSYCRGLKRRNLMRYRLKRILYDFSDEDFNQMIDAVKDFKPKLTRVSWAFAYAILTLGRKKPRLFTKHKILRKIINVSERAGDELLRFSDPRRDHS